MKILIRSLSVFLLSIAILAGCASKGGEFLGTWVNVKDANDQFVVTKNGDQFLIASQGNKVGAIYKDGALEVRGPLLSADLTYLEKSDSIITPGFIGQVEYRRKK